MTITANASTSGSSKKKQNKVAAVVAAPAATTEETVVEAVEDVSKEEKKKRKKEKKEKKAAEEAAAAASSTPAAAAPSDEDEAAKKAAKKAEKKAKKAAAAAAASTSSPSSPSSSSAPSKVSSGGYNPHPSILKQSPETVEAFRAEKEMTLAGENHDSPQYYPIHDFSKAGFSEVLLTCTKGFKSPTAIQAQTWPVILSGRDVIGIAETGSGKTLGFALPGCVHLLKATNGVAPVGKRPARMLVLCPTRELAMQSADVCVAASSPAGLKTLCIYGGADKQQQKYQITQGVDIIVATPGRLLNLMEEGSCNLTKVDYIVLDEADRMLDLGFEPDIRAIMKVVQPSEKRQTLMFSATWPETIQKLAHEFIKNPIQIVIGKITTDLTTNARITQHVEVLEDHDRDRRLMQLLQMHHHPPGAATNNKVLVFVLYKKEVDRVERMLMQKGYNVKGVSSDKAQHEREKAIADFKSGKVKMLVATDVAARGLDIDNIEYVINYSFPLTIEDYVHRIGRTGRGGKTGIAYTFFTKNDKGLSGELVNVLNDAKQNVPADLMKFGTAVKRKKHSMFGDFYGGGDDRPMKKAVKVTFD